MERRTLFSAALLTAAALSSACNDLGTCDDPAKGRTTVTVGGELMFTGQAILLQSCAQGCHSSGAKNAARQGAPAELDFDLRPIAGGTPVMSGGTIEGLDLDDAQLKGLRTRQRKVFEERERIWEQVQKGLMPPTSTFEQLGAIARAMFSSGGACPVGARLTTLGQHKEELRNWLACDVPIVEASDSQLPWKPLPANATPAESAAGSGYYAIPNVSVGYQYPSCGGGPIDSVPSFSDVYTTVLSTCAVCHQPGGLNTTVDFSSEDAAWMSLMGASGMGRPQNCPMNTSPYVTPNDPAKSYLLNKMDAMSSSAQRCDDVMPQGTGSSASQIALVTRWIMGGALRMPAAGSGGAADAGAGGAAP